MKRKMGKRRSMKSRCLFGAALVLLLAGSGSAIAGAIEDGAAAYQNGDYETAVKLWWQAANQGNADAQLRLAQLYETGKAVAKDDGQAVILYRRAAERDNPNAQVRLGLMYLMGSNSVPHDVALGLEWIDKAASRGSVEAENLLADMYSLGMFGVPKDAIRSAGWYRKAALQGNTRSMLKLIAISSAAGDHAETLMWSRKLAELGDATGQYTLGLMYGQGLGVPKDKIQALAWLKKAAAQPGFTAGLAKAAIEQFGDAPPPTPPPSDFDAIRRLAEQGNPEAQNNLGVIYQNRKSALNDDGQAVVWFRKAAEQGYAPAEANLSDMYFEGRGVRQDGERVRYWLQKAAEHGDATSQRALSGAYYTGTFGVQKDQVKSLEWLMKAADQGHAGALRDLAQTYELGTRGVSKDADKAVYWYKKSAERGDSLAQYFIGTRYEQGNGVQKDINQAIFWLRKAADHDQNDFAQNLAAKALERLGNRPSSQQDR
jgi:TPR repeat protein